MSKIVSIFIWFAITVSGVSVQAQTAETFRLTTADNFDIAAKFFPATNSDDIRPTLILAHGSVRTKEQWENVDFVDDLHAAGWNVLTFDIRGRGDSQAPTPEQRTAPPWADLDAAVAWALADPRVDQDRMAMVGESFGANLIVTGMQRAPWPITTFVSLSATPSVFVIPFDRNNRLTHGYYVGSINDRIPNVDATARILDAITRGQSEALIVDDYAHGTEVLANPETREAVLDWLHQTLDE